MNEPSRTAPMLNTATLVFVVLAAVILGGLIGLALIRDRHRHGDEATLAAASASVPSAEPGEALPFRLFDASVIEAQVDDDGMVMPGALGQNIVHATGTLQREVRTISLAPDEAIEIKAIMSARQPLVYQWDASAPIYVDFHGHDERNESGYYTRYNDGELRSDRGGIVAAYDGQHGWYWHNRSDQPVTITLSVAGYFNELVNIDFGSG